VRLACAAALFFSAGACSAPTAVVVDLTLRDGDPAPVTLTASVFDRTHALAMARAVPAPHFPGVLALAGLPDEKQTLRIACDGDPRAVAGVTVEVVPHATTHVAALLSAATFDADGDGVPDDIDNCVAVANADQADSNGDGVGNACSSDGDMRPDLSGVVPSGCPVAGAVLCEGWDSTIGPLWKVELASAVSSSITIDSAHVFRGTSALHLHTEAIPGGVYTQLDLAESATFPMDTMYLRTYVYLPSASEPLGSDLLQLYQDNAEPYGYAFLTIDDGGHIGFADTVSTPSQTLASATALPTDRWVCLEWAFTGATSDLAGASGTSDVWLDGVAVPELHATMNVASWPPFHQLALADDDNAGARPNGTDVWFDELAIGPQRIGCE
jgi:hypothetical protein